MEKIESSFECLMKSKTLIIITFYLLIFNLVLGLSSCEKHKRSQSVNSFNPKILDENFETFYSRFYSDSTFQFSRVNFPIQKEIYIGEGNINLDKDKLWTTKNWEILNTLKKDTLIQYNDNTESYRKEIKKEREIIVEKIYIEDSGYMDIRTFKVINKKWKLVSYELTDI